MNWLDLPSLNSLKAFSALADSQSYTAAGKALNVTHAAVSQQVRALEERLDIALVQRDGRGVNLTPAGHALARELTSAFETIQRAVQAVAISDVHRPVQVSMSPAFAVAWLMPRLIDFQTMHPDITLLLNPTSELVDLTPGGIDVAMRYRDARGSTAPVDEYLKLDMLVVATPGLIGDHNISDPAQLIEFPWLQELGTNEVADWFAMQGVKLDRPLMISHMPGNLIMEAVRRGDGVTYTPRALVAKELKSGHLVELFCEPDFGMLYLKTQPGIQRKSVRTFIQWLRKQAAE